MIKRQHKNRIIIATVVMILVVAVCIFLGVEFSSSREESTGRRIHNNKPWLEMRLPKSVVPNKYSLFLDVAMETFSYNGVVKVNISVMNATNFILLHKVGLNITGTKVEEIQGQKDVQIEETFAYAANEFWVIKLKERLSTAHTYTVIINFEGIISSDLSGFYRNIYVDKHGFTQRLALTFFSPISARKAFPCFDEPALKAHFQITLKHDSNFTALSNMPVESEELNPDYTRTTKFQSSLKMSTYIICWMISKFNHKTLNTPDNLEIKLWARDSLLNSTVHSLNLTKELLGRMEKYFNISFPLKKLDIAAIPSFGPGAMENWGLITYRETRLVFTDDIPSATNRLGYTIVSHELVHQWFGNLATMKFWTEVWLKEGFANFIGIFIANKLQPSIELMKNNLPDYLIPALDLDAFATSNPISTEAKTPDEIREVFGVITYMKGYCVVQMLQHFMGEKSFRKGLQRYLRTYAYSNANQDDLWEQLSLETQGKDIKAVMDTWTLQMGYPVITIRRINNTHVRVEQQKFSLDPPGTDLPPSPLNYNWHVPISFKQIDAMETQEYLLTTKTAVIKMPPRSMVNPQHELYYRVNYDKEMVLHITELLKKSHAAISMSDRAGLISDQFSLFKAKLTNLSTVVNLVEYIKNETENVPWVVAIAQMHMINGLLEPGKDKTKWEQFMKGLMEVLIQHIGWNRTSSATNNELQINLLNSACDLNITSIVDEAEGFYREWMRGNSTLRKELHPIMIKCTISHHSNVENDLWRFAHKEYLKTKDLSILSALAFTKNEQLLERLLEESMNQTIVNMNYASTFVGEIAKASKTGLHHAWAFLKENWNEFTERYGSNIFLLGRMITAILPGFSTTEQLDDVETFFKDKHLGSGKKALQQSVLKIKFRIWYKETIKQSAWFQQ